MRTSYKRGENNDNASICAVHPDPERESDRGNPDINMDELRRAVDTRAAAALEEIRDIVCAEEMTDTEKVGWIQKRLELG